MKWRFNKTISECVKKNEIPITLKEENEKYERERKFKLSSNNLKQLEEWTSLKCDEILFDNETELQSKHKDIKNITAKITIKGGKDAENKEKKLASYNYIIYKPS